MPIQVTVHDERLGLGRETADGDGPLVLEFLTERITVRELIRSRVYEEVQDYNRRRPERYRGLVEPTDVERTLNGVRPKAGREIDWQRQFETACKAYERNGFLVLVNNRQAGGLDEEVTLGPGAEVTFVKLVPLVGG